MCGTVSRCLGCKAVCAYSSDSTGIGEGKYRVVFSGSIEGKYTYITVIIRAKSFS